MKVFLNAFLAYIYCHVACLSSPSAVIGQLRTLSLAGSLRTISITTVVLENE